jgi:SAM-dependent methyltransferase
MEANLIAESTIEVPADIETSSEDYASRFKGPAGEWMLDRQQRITLDLLKTIGARRVLDVGGGHGQLTGPLVRAGYDVTVHGSADICRKRIAPLVDAGKCQFVTSSFLALPFPDRSFDAVVSVRLIMHTDQWPRLIAEMCRVARHAVLVDYPSVSGMNMLSPLLFGAKKRLEKNTRAWRNFRHTEVAEAFSAQGFHPVKRQGQFFFPMVIHRTLQLPLLSSALEGASGLLGLNRCWGSPVLARFDRGGL